LWAVALITGAGFLLTRLNYIIGASVAATIAANCILSLAYAAAAGLLLVSFSSSRASAPEGSSPADAEGPRSPIWTLIALTLAGAIVITVGAVFAGYTTLATLVSGQIFWLSLIASVVYLLLRFIDDLCEALFHPHGWATRILVGLFNLRSSSVRQSGILISAGLQLLVLIAALSLALTPFGQSGDLLLSRISQLGHAFKIGSATVSPGAIAAGIATFAVGMGIVHLARGWLVRRYLPATDWDSGLRNSVSTGVGYLGVGVVLVSALAATGLGFSQIALIASALSVGIGFGLQQIVQNFVAGIILLIERPVKVGDWVVIGGVEGDIRRIRVRATEITAGDRSTMIVPNSELITKTIQNKSLSDPLGQVLIQVQIARASDARKASELILNVAKANRAVLPDPAPAVFVDALNPGGGVNLACACAVGSPRDAYGVRSQIYFDVLDAFQEAGVFLLGAIAPPPAPQ
jgi:small-conductance mechanosensitive channel